MDSRCYDHRIRKNSAPACPVCLRIRTEVDIVTRTVDALLQAGYKLNITNGGDDYELPNWSADRDVVLAALGATDDERLYARRASLKDHDLAYVYFVYGNDGYDVISDYTVSLEDVLAPVNAYADSLS